MIRPSLLLKVHPNAAVLLFFFHAASEKQSIESSKSSMVNDLLHWWVGVGSKVVPCSNIPVHSIWLWTVFPLVKLAYLQILICFWLSIIPSISKGRYQSSTNWGHADYLFTHIQRFNKARAVFRVGFCSLNREDDQTLFAKSQ